MKNIILVLIAGFVIVMAINACQKEKLEANHAIPITMENKAIIKGGSFLSGKDWLGWIDPKLVGDNIIKTEIYRETPQKWGYKEVDENNVESIACPKTGSICGRLYTISEFGKVTFIGLYLLPE